MAHSLPQDVDMSQLDPMWNGLNDSLEGCFPINTTVQHAAPWESAIAVDQLQVHEPQSCVDEQQPNLLGLRRGGLLLATPASGVVLLPSPVQSRAASPPTVWGNTAVSLATVTVEEEAKEEAPVVVQQPTPDPTLDEVVVVRVKIPKMTKAKAPKQPKAKPAAKAKAKAKPADRAKKPKQQKAKKTKPRREITDTEAMEIAHRLFGDNLPEGWPNCTRCFKRMDMYNRGQERHCDRRFHHGYRCCTYCAKTLMRREQKQGAAQ